MCVCVCVCVCACVLYPGKLSDEPPEVGTVVRGTVKRIEPYGVVSTHTHTHTYIHADVSTHVDTLSPLPKAQLVFEAHGSERSVCA